MIIKKIIIIFIILLFTVLILLGGFLFTYNKFQDFSAFSFLGKIARQEIVKKTARKIKSFIYHEATIHNPEGDILPDEIDDEILDEVKNRLK